MIELKDTAKLMASSDYKERFMAEYIQLKTRYERLKAFNTKIDASKRSPNVEEPKHDCPFELLKEQELAMQDYLRILELRAVIEGIDVNINE